MLRLERLASLAVLLTAVLCIAVLIKTFFFTSPHLIKPQEQLAGRNLSEKLPLDRTKPMLLLVISSQCHFCSESKPFYNRLLAEPALHDNISFMALMPDDQKVAMSYLQKYGLRPDRVVSMTPTQIGVRGTPTLILVNSSGVIENTWEGKLTDTEEAKVMSVLKEKIKCSKSANLSSSSSLCSVQPQG